MCLLYKTYFIALRFGHILEKLGPQQLREVRLAPQYSEYSSVTFIWNNKVAMCSLKEGIVALVVESSELANIQRAMFNLIWQTLPEPERS